MSDDKDLMNTINLSASEDAFERFQADSMYEEDDFITLSDIVPPQPAVPDISNELVEIPYDNEVVLSSTQNDIQQYSLESNEGNGQAMPITVTAGQNKASHEQKSQAQSHDTKNQTPDMSTKKGVKRKKQYRDKQEKNLDETHNTSENINDSQSSSIQDSVHSTTTDKNGMEPSLDESNEYPRRTRRERIPNTAKYPLVSEAQLSKATPGKRRPGRPRKAAVENPLNLEPDSTNTENNTNEHFNMAEGSGDLLTNTSKKGKLNKSKSRSQNGLEQNDYTTESETDLSMKGKKGGKKGKKKTGSIETVSDFTEGSNDTHNSLPESLQDSALNETNNQQFSESNNEISNPTKKVGKRGRKKKAANLMTNSLMSDKLNKTNENKADDSIGQDMDLDEDGDDICLSTLKKTFATENLESNIDLDQPNTSELDEDKRNSKMPLTSDFENIDKVVKEATGNNLLEGEDNPNESLLVEDTSKRPIRRKIKQTFKYDEESEEEEDPFANMELSDDDDEPRGRKNKRYYSDDEYIPGSKKGKPESSSSESDIDDDTLEERPLKRKKTKQTESPNKRGQKKIAEIDESDANMISLNDNEDLEECLKPSYISADESISMKPPAEAWATSNEFENFIAQKIQSTSLKIKKVSAKTKPQSAPLEIPIINPNEPKKLLESSSQTENKVFASTEVQTSAPYDIPMKTNIKLTSQQSESACEFLNSVVKTTAELGQLMKEKSEDFMNKKINTENVTDTLKMDYCVRKSFLLFKLAKHNLLQMEEDLAKQYNEFLKNNSLSSCRDELKNITPKPPPKKKEESDSDCEIVEVKVEASSSKKKATPKFNPKTVFLNKELSIKMAKKPTADKKLDIKGRHTIWINDSVMVKKVKPTQSFLAQDSRNKKPPDCVYVTEKMVSDFFNDYYRQKALAVCAPYVTTGWSCHLKEYACYYFVKCDDFGVSLETTNSETDLNTIENNVSMENYNGSHSIILKNNNPKSLVTLCAGIIQNYLHVDVARDTKEASTSFNDEKGVKKQPQTLFRLCYKNILFGMNSNKTSITSSQSANKTLAPETKSVPVPSLMILCYKCITPLLFTETEPTEINYCKGVSNEYFTNEFREGDSDYLSEDNDSYEDLCAFINNEVILPDTNISLSGSENAYQSTERTCPNINGVKPLALLCLNAIQIMLSDTNINEEMYSAIKESRPSHPELLLPKTLKCFAYEAIKNIMYESKTVDCSDVHSTLSREDTVYDIETNEDAISCLSTLKEEEIHGFHETNDFEDVEDYDYEHDTGADADEEDGENEWASQVQMQILRSCVTTVENSVTGEYEHTSIHNSDVTSVFNFTDSEQPNSIINDNYQDGTPEDVPQSNPLSMHIKLEPQDEVPESQIDPSIVKAEPIQAFHGMTIIPESVVTKTEMMDELNVQNVQSNTGPLCTTFGGDSFEQFVRTNKMERVMDEHSIDDSVFTQSALRIRREHEPDPDAGTDMDLDLLVPQTFEPLQLNIAKNVLMESSSDEDAAKKGAKKKPDKKGKRKLKKAKDSEKNNSSKEIPSATKDLSEANKEKPQSSNEVAILTRRMRDKIRQEEKKIESSDSEIENVPLSVRRDKCKDEEKSIKSLKPVEKTSKRKKEVNNDIQCNNVDSTEQIIEKDKSKFSGFSAIDQNEITTYQKYMKFVYDKIMPEDDVKSKNKPPANDQMNADLHPSRSNSPVIHPDEPVELLECEPTMPILDDMKKNKVTRQKKTKGKKKENINDYNNTTKNTISKEMFTPAKELSEKVLIPKYTERNGWHCYDIDKNDTKLYGYCHIPLDKLPESFVDTYLEYQGITDRDKIDEEVDRLTNLQSLNRFTGAKDGRSKRLKGTSKTSGSEPSASQLNSRNGSRSVSPANSDRYDELTPSEDEGANVDDEIPPPVPTRATENSMAKNSLMDDHESDSDGSPKKPKDSRSKEQHGQDQGPAPTETKRRCGPKSKTKDLPPSDSLMLTADKMMNKELTLLHAPIVMKQEVPDTAVKEPSPKEDSKTRKKSSRAEALRKRIRTEDDSSSEEEKQWVSTKEKLLKRLGKKEDASLDDAKRAKLVTEFIERRGGAPGKGRRAIGSGGRRSKKKFLEQQKQLRVLSKELFGEPTGGKRGTVGLFKGRRNIRKVIDKKSLQRGTVLANMEEFERKRRLNSRQTMLRELHGCEEGVNVLVINDEVCLEYDFVQHRPIVTVHPFFTKVMKAHQYEGVKFMWDACFESLSCIEAGHPGGGCILAHCMGLGKTLQVLALLHTVLTHPRVGMQRVLVCCPLSTVLNWVDEIHKWIGPVTDEIKVFELSKLKKTYERAYQLEDWYNGGGIFIIGYELFRSLTTLDPLIDDVRLTIINKIRTALLDPGPDIIICDEGHLLKNDCSVLAVAMSRVVTKRRIILTGTPMQNNLREYYCMVNFVKPSLLGTYSEYSNRFENPIMNGQHRDSQTEDIKLMKARTHILHKVLEGCLQRQEASVLYPYLPKKHEYTVFIPLTKCQWDLYKHYVHHYTKKSKQSVLKDFHILQKIWSHPQVLHNFQIKARDEAKRKETIKAEKLEDDLALEDKEEIKPPATEVWWMQYVADGAMLNSLESSNKFIAVFRILKESIELGDKVLIFSTSLFCLDALEYFLQQMNNWSLGQEYYRLDGSVPPEVRQKWCREFNAENNIKTKLFLISTRAGCLGLNMTAANRVIILDTSWNPAHDIQSIFRVYRFGQKKDCFIYRLVAMGTMEQKIYERSVTKQAVACRVVDEQQIDRHYNMAELTELYRFDEQGSSVAGGVAVGVSDVALLRVARDESRAVHAVHEHDSLLRGSAEPNLPEHERAAAWMQFQQEHAHTQMQNDIDANKKAKALKKLEEREMKAAMERQQSLVAKIKTEEGPIHDSTLLQTPKNLTVKGPRRKGKSKIVQCRIPIRSDSQPGPSKDNSNPMSEQEMVRQITHILIKHNFTKSGTGPKQISELVSKVKQMVATGKAISLGPGCDELTASIASVMMNRHMPAKPPPPLTDINEQPKPPPASKPWQDNLPQETLPREERRGRRRAAIVAEKSFEKQDDNSQDSVRSPSPENVVQLDEEWLDSDTDSVPESPPLVKKPQGPKPGPKSQKQYESIELSDDEAPQPQAKESSQPQAKESPPATSDGETVILHPSLLSNQNFIKIVAHTYLAGNPMLDEDAATLAAQYSTLKALKEVESTGKAIDSGPIYDIAIQVLGKEVLKKLQKANPKSNSSAEIAIPSIMEKLRRGADTEPAPSGNIAPATTTAPVKPKMGPKSRVTNPIVIKNENAVPTTSQRQTAAVPIGLVKSASELGTASPAPAPDECILPDDEVQCVTPAIQTNLPRFKIIQTKPALKPVALSSLKAPVVEAGTSKKNAVEPTTSANTAAIPRIKRGNQYATICLDSDEEDPAPAPARPRGRPRKTTSQPTATQQSAPSVVEPVPVALTGPDARSIPLAPVAPPAPDPVPVSLTGPDARPVPVSLTGPGFRAIPFSLAGPDGQFVRLELADGQTVPVGSAGSIVVPAATHTVRAKAATPSVAQHVANNLYLVPTSQPQHGSKAGGQLTRVAAAQVPAAVRLQVLQAARVVPVPSLSAGRVVLDARARPAGPAASEVHLIDDEEPPAAAAPPKIAPRPAPAGAPARPGPGTTANQTGGKKPAPQSKEASPLSTRPPPQTKETPSRASPAPRSGVESGRKRKVSSSSSGSDSSRASSPDPDPLSILKDVVHIQAPRRGKTETARGRSAAKAPEAPCKAGSASVDTRVSDISKKLNKIVDSVKKRSLEASTSKTVPGKSLLKTSTGNDKKAPGNVKDTVDLTDVADKPVSVRPKTTTSQVAKMLNNLLPVVDGVKNKSPKPAPSTSKKKDFAATVVGTTKNIVLDGKSKSLTNMSLVDLTGQKSVHVTNVKTIQPTAKKPKQEIKTEPKRTAPPPAAPAPKKKKTELMTLKDFDIDDIDDIIELD